MLRSNAISGTSIQDVYLTAQNSFGDLNCLIFAARIPISCGSIPNAKRIAKKISEENAVKQKKPQQIWQCW